MAEKSYLLELKERVETVVGKMREMTGHDEELVLLIPTSLYYRYPLGMWDGFGGVEHVEREDVMPEDVEFIVMNRTEYLRMFIKSLGEKESD